MEFEACRQAWADRWEAEARSAKERAHRALALLVPLLEALDATRAMVVSDLEAFDAFLEAVAR